MVKPLENLALMTKVVIPTAVMLAVALGIVALAERSLGQLTAQTHEIIAVTATRQALALQAEASLDSVAADEKNAMLMTDKSGLDFFASAYMSDLDRLKDSVAKLALLPHDPGEADRLRRMNGFIDAYGGTGEQLYQFMVDRNFDAAHALSTGPAQQARDRLLALIRDEVDQSAAQMRQAQGQADKRYRRSLRLLLGLSAAGLLCALGMIGWITKRFIVRPLRTMTEAMGRLSGGDLAITIEGADRRDEIGVLARALTIFRDQSIALRENTRHLEAAHAEIAELNAVLERRVEERTAELEAAHEALLRKERLAALGQITATVAHELRNPLGVIRNSVAAIEGAVGKAGLDLARPLGRIDRGIGRCDGIIAELLDFARIREISPSPTMADEWLLEVLLEQSLPADVHLAHELASPGCEIEIDADRMRRVVVNLVENAAQALAEPGAAETERRITVTTAASSESWEFVIADTGPGIAPATLARVFEPLFSTKSFGTGLGLPTVKQIVEQHGGRIDLTSIVGTGTRVAIRLPRAQAAEIAA
jgi:signal transduction histidine kinase